MMKGKNLFVFAALFSSLSFAETNWTGGVRPGGNGFYLSAPDQGFNLNFLGYGQFVGTVLDEKYNSVRSDTPFGFNIRRARLTTLATVQRNAEFMIEMGTPTMRPIPLATNFPSSAAAVAAGTVDPTTLTHAASHSATDFGLVEARVSLNLFEDWLQLRIGKFTGPFSRENSRSSRQLDFIERSNVMSSMLLSPALDTQIGAMLFGRFADGILNYYFGVFNGNSDSIGTLGDNDGGKEIQLKLEIHPHKNFMVGLGWDTDYVSKARPLSLVDHALTPVVSSAVAGRRHGFSLDWDWLYNFFSWKSEFLYFSFPDNTGTANYARFLIGGFTQIGFQVAGDTNSGLQILLRYEYAKLLTTQNYDLHSGILGFNIFINSNLTNTINYILEYGGNNVGSGHYAQNGYHHAFMNQLQVKF